MIGDEDGHGNGILHKHGYACKRRRVFDRVFYHGTLKNCPPVFVSFFRERAYSI